MQLYKIKDTIKLANLSDAVGDRNIDQILAANRLKRTPNIGRAFRSICDSIIADSTNVTIARKKTLLNSLTHESDIFEVVALQGESGWKVYSDIGALPGILKIPESIVLPDSVDTLGDHQPIGNRIYKQVMDSLTNTGKVDPSIFNEYTGIKNSQLATITENTSGDPFQMFKVPWGEVTLHSSLDDDYVDFPVYPEELGYSRSANYTQMPDMLYQYEPWQTYQSSGPTSVSYTFKFHRDMWTGNHEDGKANDLIRFCEANCYPEYRGSAVDTSIVTLYVCGNAHISGVMTGVDTKWSGPLGRDGWYLVCELTLNITEVSSTPLNYSTVKKKSLIG